MNAAEVSIHEVDFCSQVASAANVLFAQDPDAFPFAEARVEGYGSGATRRKRKDLRFFEPATQGGRLALCGEVKLPGTPEGRSAFDDRLYQDAAQKADSAGVRFFFTWNVNEFVLWDRSQWEKPPLERRVRSWPLGLTLGSPEEVARPENLEFVRTRFLPELLRDLAEIYSGRRRDWTMPPDDIFIRSLESHLDWPVQLATAHVLARAGRDRAFDSRVQKWLADQDQTFVRNDSEQWRSAISNLAKTLAYVWANRIIFYKALRARFGELPRLELKRTVKTASGAAAALNGLFQQAIERSGDYETLLIPNSTDWAAEIVFEAPNALDAWRGLLRGIESVDFKDVPSDIVGRIFQKLISPAERHRYGQHFTGDNVVDVINSFCIRDGADAVLDPACGSGSFLVRAYYRKRWLAPQRNHVSQLADLFGCDIAWYPAHLATLNLAAREISDDANYPRIARRDFFDSESSEPFCIIPNDRGGTSPVMLPALDAVVGNPPYVRQEKVEKSDKAKYARLATAAWRDLKLSGRADLHCYFWPVAAKLLRPHGHFGFLTSSSWLDVEYGFSLQGWILRHFKLLAVLESHAEPWFTDARVKTAVTILQRCADESQRMSNAVRFVRLDKPLRDIIGVAAGDDEAKRQAAVDRLRDRILAATTDEEDGELRIIVKRQADLWTDGIRAGAVVRHLEFAAERGDAAQSDEPTALPAQRPTADDGDALVPGEYAAGKWGRYLRAPDLYFEIMREYGRQFIPLGAVATVRFGMKSGCDDFFMPHDVTANVLREADTDVGFRRIAGGAPRKDVESGKLRVVRAGDGSVHAIEAEFLAAEVHSLMKVDRPIVRAKDVSRVVLLVDRPLRELRGTWVHRYLKYGEQATFASTKSKAVPVPQRSTCAARDPWYDLTKSVKPGFAFWPMAQQYRHIIAGNPERLVCNHNLFDLHSKGLSSRLQKALWAILNSTLVGLFKTFYGRWAGTEGNLKTEVVDVNLLEIPDPRRVDAAVAGKLAAALKSMSRRTVGRLVEEQLMDCHSPERARRIAAGPLALSNELRQEDRRALDDAVFELLGVGKATERSRMVHRLHEDTARHFRALRVVEIEKMEQRSRTTGRRFSVHELAADAWDAAELPDVVALTEWIGKRPECARKLIVPEERPAFRSPSPMFDPNTVYFGRRGGKKAVYLECRTDSEARLVMRLSELGVSGEVAIANSDDGNAHLLTDVNRRILAAERRFQELAEARTAEPRLQLGIVEQLRRWFVLGRSGAPATPSEDAASD